MNKRNLSAIAGTLALALCLAGCGKSEAPKTQLPKRRAFLLEQPELLPLEKNR